MLRNIAALGKEQISLTYALLKMLFCSKQRVCLLAVAAVRRDGGNPSFCSSADCVLGSDLLNLVFE